jgi:HAD superfamily hydrolase (TIGR01509 family)
MQGAIRAVAFDLFGTLVELAEPRNPYGRLLAALGLGAAERAQARRRLMSEPIGLAGVAPALGLELEPHVLAEAEQDLYRELASVRLFPEVADVLRRLRAEGFRIALASNLALPYAVPVRLLLPFELDAQAWSFELGAIKPDAAFYAQLCRRLGCAPADVLMVGDTFANDVEGARAAGLQALHLDRSGVAGSGAIRSLADLSARIAAVARPGGAAQEATLPASE